MASRDFGLAQSPPDVELPEQLTVDVTRAIRQLSGGFRWDTTLRRAAFESCAGEAIGECLTLTPPLGKALDPGLKQLLLGAALGFAAAKGGAVYLLGAAALIMLKRDST